MKARREITGPFSRGDTRLTCRACGGTKQVSRMRQELRVRGKERVHAAAECSGCKRKSWSRHPVAIAISKQLDAEATGS